MKIHDPGNTKKIDKIYAVLSTDEHGMEGIVASTLQGTGWLPFVTSDFERAELFLKQAKLIFKSEGIKGKVPILASFSRETEQ